MSKHSVIPLPSIDRLASGYLFLVGRNGDAKPVIQAWLKSLVIDPLDQVWVEGDKLTIADVRSFQTDMVLAPLASPRRVGIMPNAHHLTSDAGHSLLKFLEDPPSHAMIILGAEYEDQLLPTIVSRCQRWRVGDSRAPSTEQDPEWDVLTLRKKSYTERLRLAEAWAKEEDFADRFDALITSARRALFAQKLQPADIERLLWYRSLVATNVVPRLLAEVTLLSLGKESH